VPAFWWIVVAGWVVVGGLALRAGSAAWLHAPRALRWLVGLLALWATWLAIVHARGIGLGFVLSVFCVVWVADIGAYFGGRRFGRHKLAPAISPGKTWEGVWAGVAAVLVLAAVWLAGQQSIAELGPSLFSALADRFGPVLGAAALVVLSGFGVAGDLIESLVKRAAGAKDSSRLLPGHGGVLDRVDALLPVFPLALALTGR
jgi:phosphatidate cytidylyltransferase